MDNWFILKHQNWILHIVDMWLIPPDPVIYIQYLFKTELGHTIPGFFIKNLMVPQSPVPVEDEAGWGGGGGGNWEFLFFLSFPLKHYQLGKNFHKSQNCPLRQILTFFFWCIKHEIKLSGWVSKPRCCRNWCKSVFCFFQIFRDKSLLGGLALVLKRG